MRQGTTELTEGSLKLRRYKKEDIIILYEKLGCDPQMMRYTGWNPYHSLEAATGFISGIIESYAQATGDYSWIIEYDGQPAGIIGAYDYKPEENCIEIGYSIFRDCWGRGYASKALDLVCNYLMQNEGIQRLKAWSAVENIASRKVLEHAGFVKTEIKEAAINVNGESFDQVIYQKEVKKMSKIIVLTGSVRKNGNTDLLAKAFGETIH